MVRHIVPSSTAWAKVNEKGGSGEGVGPKGSRDMSVEQKGANTVVKSAENALSMTILLRGVRTSDTFKTYLLSRTLLLLFLL
jgi:hypothetical protein